MAALMLLPPAEIPSAEANQHFSCLSIITSGRIPTFLFYVEERIPSAENELRITNIQLLHV